MMKTKFFHVMHHLKRMHIIRGVYTYVRLGSEIEGQKNLSESELFFGHFIQLPENLWQWFRRRYCQKIRINVGEKTTKNYEIWFATDIKLLYVWWSFYHQTKMISNQ